MSRARHELKKRAKGGAVAYAGGDSNVMREAKERKRGGRVHHMHVEGEQAKHRADKRARSGHVKHKEGSRYEEAHESVAERKREAAEGRKRGGHVMHMTGDGHEQHHEHGEKHAHEAHRRGRKRGGGVGANLTPLSTAAKIKEVTKGEEPEDEPKDGKGGSPIA